MLEVLTDVSEEPTAAIYTYTLNMIVVVTSESWVYTLNITEFIKPKNQYLKQHKSYLLPETVSAACSVYCSAG
jgi:hypothetical protein